MQAHLIRICKLPRHASALKFMQGPSDKSMTLMVGELELLLASEFLKDENEIDQAIQFHLLDESLTLDGCEPLNMSLLMSIPAVSKIANALSLCTAEGATNELVDTVGAD